MEKNIYIYFIREKISYRWNNWWINLKTFCQKSEVDKNTNTDKHNSCEVPWGIPSPRIVHTIIKQTFNSWMPFLTLTNIQRILKTRSFIVIPALALNQARMTERQWRVYKFESPSPRRIVKALTLALTYLE